VLFRSEIARLAGELRDGLGADAYDNAYARGRAAAREDAIALLDPSDAPAVRP